MSAIDLLRKLAPYDVKKYVHRARHQQRLYLTRRQYAPAESPAATVAAVARLTARPDRTVLFYPSLPDYTQVVYKLCVLNNYRMVNDPHVPHEVVHKHKDRTVSELYEPVERAGRHAVNAASNDIRKARVQEVFEAIFGYALEVDPTVYCGAAVRKSDANAQHDGAVIECPCEVGGEADVVYQRLVDTRTQEGLWLDQRVPVYGGEVPLVYRRYKSDDNQFTNRNVHAEIAEPYSVFSADELAGIRRFSEAMGLDFGEMDVLRHNEDGRIYIVDVNNTPFGPPIALSMEQQRQALAILAPAYRALVEQRVAS